MLGAGAFFFSASTLARRVSHQIDHPRRWRPPNRRDLFAGLLLLEQIKKGVLVSILEARWIEVASLGADDVTCKIEHVLGKL